MIDLDIDGININYTVQNRNVKHSRLEFKSINEILIVLPLGKKDEKDLISQKKGWIKKKVKAIKKSIETIKKYAENVNGENQLLLFGKYRNLIYSMDKSNIEIRDEEIIVPVSGQDKSLNYVKSWLKKELREFILGYINSLDKETTKKINKIYIRTQKTKWGSCSSKGNLSFNLKLAALPQDLIQYVVFHEVNHLNNRLHDKNFWKSISTQFLDYEKNEELLAGFWFLSREILFWNNI